MKSIYYVSLWLVLLVCGGKGLAQTSSTDKPNNHPLYATIRVGATYGPIPDCTFPVGLVNQIGIGWQLNPSWRLGVGSHYLEGSFGWFEYYDYRRRFFGTGLQAGWHKGRLDLSLEAGHAWIFQDGCFFEITSYGFRGGPGIRPYIAITPAFYLSRRIHLFASWMQTANLDTNHTYITYGKGDYVYGGGVEKWRIQSLQFGVGVRLGR